MKQQSKDVAAIQHIILILSQPVLILCVWWRSSKYNLLAFGLTWSNPQSTLLEASILNMVLYHQGGAIFYTKTIKRIKVSIWKTEMKWTNHECKVTAKPHMTFCRATWKATGIYISNSTKYFVFKISQQNTILHTIFP